MALASAPSTSERALRAPLNRRAFTAPIRNIRQNLPVLEADPQGAETLYAHGAGKILSFSTSNSLARTHSSTSDERWELHNETTGTLPWTSLTERTIAAGPLRVYRVLGSVSFLNSGNILQPILAKSQCWCVDGVSKFVLRIRPNSYYRIELPYTTPQDKDSVEQFKAILAKILQYEMTPCPFKRGFIVELPEPPKTPIRKKPWKPKPQENSEVSSIRRLPTEPDNLGAVDDVAVKRDHSQDNMRTESSEEYTTIRKVADFPLDSSDAAGSSPDAENRNVHEPKDGTYFTQKQLYEKACEELLRSETPTRTRRIVTGRTVTAPPQLSVRTSPPSKSSGQVETMSALKQETSSLSSSVDSFHSFHSPISPLPLSPPSSESLNLRITATDSDTPRVHLHKRDESEATVTADSQELWDLSDTEIGQSLDRPQTPTLVSDATSQDEEWERVKTPSPPGLRVRQNVVKRRRAHSPLPSSSNIYSPYSPRRNLSGHHLTTAILQRTCSLLLGPPVQLVALMLRIAAKIAKGAFKGESFGWGEPGQRIPCSWDFSDGSDGDASEEDDYGVALGKTISGKEVRSQGVGGSWEID